MVFSISWTIYRKTSCFNCYSSSTLYVYIKTIHEWKRENRYKEQQQTSFQSKQAKPSYDIQERYERALLRRSTQRLLPEIFACCCGCEHFGVTVLEEKTVIIEMTMSHMVIT